MSKPVGRVLPSVVGCHRRAGMAAAQKKPDRPKLVGPGGPAASRRSGRTPRIQSSPIFSGRQGIATTAGELFGHRAAKSRATCWQRRQPGKRKSVGCVYRQKRKPDLIPNEKREPPPSCGQLAPGACFARVVTAQRKTGPPHEKGGPATFHDVSGRETPQFPG